MKKSSKEILNKIKNGKLKMKPRWRFVAEDIGIKTIAAMGLMGAAIGISMIGFFWEMYDPRELTNYGEIGWQLLREDFPYFWLISALALGVAAWYLEPKIGDNYKKSSWFWMIISLVGIVILAIGVTVLRKLLKF